MAAQTSVPAQAPAKQHHARPARHKSALQRLTASLNLTADQQNQVKAILKDSQSEAKSLRAQLKDQRAALESAVKSDSSQQIDEITQKSAQVNAQIRAVRAKAMAKIYAVLTPEQKTQVDSRLDRMFGQRARQHRSARS